MKLFYSATSPYVRKVMVCAHELGLAGKIELLSTAVSPVETNATLAAENPLMKIPALPISYSDAQPLLASLTGRVVPENWRGALPMTT